jgi:hypothetical protein
MEQVAQAVGDDTAKQILVIANREDLSYTFPEMLCHLGAFLVRPLMSVSNLTRTVWK